MYLRVQPRKSVHPLLILVIAVLAIGADALGVAAAQNLLRVHVVGLRNDDGNLNCALFDSTQDFPEDRQHLAVSVTAPISGGAGTCEFRGITVGTYAVVVFHDRDRSGTFKRNWIGMPEEGYGFSNDAPARFRAPSFEEASFPFTGGSYEILIHIRY